MRRSSYIILFFVVGIVVAGFRFVDAEFLKNLKTKLQEFNQSYPDERVYLQFDKTFYKPGEDIWFKAYVVNGTTMKPTDVSTAMYVELIDPRGQTISKSELYVDDGAAHGDFRLSENLPGGLYTVRAFTRWMQNFPEENFFTKQLTVQSVITPRLLLKVDFEKKAYGKGDVVTAQLKVRNLKDNPIEQANINAKLNIDGKEYDAKTFTTNLKGEADVTFQLPADLNTTDGLLQIVVSTGGVEESISRSVPIVLNKIKLQFYPEGGDMVAGSNGKVAFEALNEFGKGADVSGVVVDETGRTVVTFGSYHNGMGAFKMPAEIGHHYTARITQPLGIDEVYKLPAVKQSGLSLSLEVTGDSIISKVFSSIETQVFLVGHVHGEVYVANMIKLNKGWNRTAISSKSMPVGIAAFTLFDAEGVESSERLTFINRNKTLHIELSTDRKEYNPGDGVELKLKTTDESGSPLRANLSVAVVDDQLITLADDKQDNILSWLLMSSELKGKIEEPSFYFNEDEPKSKMAMDYLLMVHGWRRFTWKEVFTPTKKISFIPENERNVGGLVLNKAGKGSSAEVVMMELNNRKRIAKVTANKDGQFLFHNVDASTRMVLLTKKPNRIEVNGVRSRSNDDPGYYYDTYQRYRVDPIFEMDEQMDKGLGAINMPVEEVVADLAMAEDVSQLSEVVVVGYGVEEKRSLGGSVVSIAVERPFLPMQSIEQLLAGRVAGVMLTQQAQPNAGSSVVIRGASTLGNQSEPLWVIDGVPMSRGVDGSLPIGTQLTPSNIESISVIAAAEAMGLYGSRGSNGVIVVTTKMKIGYSNLNYTPSTPKYSVLTIEPRKFTKSREFYSGPASKEERNNFKTTVYWKHSVVTDEKGEAKIQFKNNDIVSAFRITAEGFSGTGLIGHKEVTYHTLLPFALDTKIPNYLGFEDTLKLPVRITNNTSQTLKGKLSVKMPSQLRSIGNPWQNITVEANRTITIPISIITTSEQGEFPISIELDGDNYHDKIKQLVRVHPIGFPVYYSYSGKDLKKSIDIPMKDFEKGSATGEVVFVTDLMKDVFRGVEAMLGEPHGCFEQTSSSTFPNVLILQFLRRTGRSTPALEQKALNYIDIGYKRLAGFEVKSGGFDWFGNPPSHEALTAFGLLEFMEMKKVYPQVNAEMIERTKTWLLSRRTGKGTFKQIDHAYDSFSGTFHEVNNAYIVYALSEAGMIDLDKEYSHSFAEAFHNKDMYMSALMANAALNYSRPDDFIKMKNHLTAAVEAVGLSNIKMTTSFTNSYGRSLTTEGIALWALALMREENPDYKLIAKCVDFITSQKSFGRYGSTQATYLSLKVMIEYYAIVRNQISDCEIAVSINGANEVKRSFNKDTKENIIINNFSEQLKHGNNNIGISFANTKEALPFSVNLKWNSKTPQSSNECKLKIQTSLTKSKVAVNETVRLNIKTINTTQRGVPMTLAIVGIPAGLSLQPWQLKELQEKKVFDFYEINNDNLVIYYRGLSPNEVKEVNLDLKAEVPGTFLSTASCAYQYYTDEFKHWTEGSKVTVY